MVDSPQPPFLCTAWVGELRSEVKTSKKEESGVGLFNFFFVSYYPTVINWK